MATYRISRPEDIGAVLVGYRKDHVLTQAELAEKLGVSARWLSHMENGKQTVQLGLVLRVFNELSIVLTATPEADTSKTSSGNRRPARVTDIDTIVDD